ncbi:MAG TPA: ATP-binding protein [Sedimentisphaerales bacterium]|nr:ATP-binding protein [Sedimentisphaerales bacterium]HRS11570.1 ATP-binding protein [Sedimentisphaerales bacterium]HRV48178.1 ATP-binding protein [Sedimentisphaerales bacterium]
MAIDGPFSEEMIQAIFGHEAAEDEDKDRLRQYYFKSSVFDRVCSDLPLRILVGHKGIGKSALISIAMQEDTDDGILAVLIRPDEVHEIDTDEKDLLASIRSWKAGLLRIIYQMVLSRIGVPSPAKTTMIAKGVQLLDLLADVLRPVLERAIDIEASQRRVAEQFMKERKLRVYLDDLDRGWAATAASISRLSALLNALRDISRESEGVQFRVALRSDVYFLVRTSDESTDKIEGAVVWHTWTNHEILAMLVKRIESFLGRERTEEELIRMKQKDLASFLYGFMEERFQGYGKWQNIPTHRMLMTLIRRRPRDLVKLCTLAAHRAASEGRSIIITGDFLSIFDEYSQGRLQDTFNEYRSELPAIEPLLLGMKPSQKEWRAGHRYTYTTDELLHKIRNVQASNQAFRFFGKQSAASPKELAAFMYKIGFITARKEVDGRIVRKYFDESRYLSPTFSDFGFNWEVHPAYRWALQPDTPMKVFDNLDPTEEEN